MSDGARMTQESYPDLIDPDLRALDDAYGELLARLTDVTDAVNLRAGERVRLAAFLENLIRENVALGRYH